MQEVRFPKPASRNPKHGAQLPRRPGWLQAEGGADNLFFKIPDGNFLGEHAVPRGQFTLGQEAAS
jgi:hypothetical protein